MKTIYGPVPSWRFGRSLGIDPVCQRIKICSFDCSYCQLGKTKVKTTERKEYAAVETVRAELEETDKKNIDTITFSGTSEPTLNSKIGEMIGIAKGYGFPVAVLTNSSLLHLEEVRKELCTADIVAAKLDAHNEEIFQKINAPAEGIHFDRVFESLKKFRSEFSGKFALQMMFIADNRDYAEEMAELARLLKPDEVQLNTPLRRSRFLPLSFDEMHMIERHFDALPFISVYKRKAPITIPFDIGETRARRPE